jgi:hypothetical protein
MAHYRPNYWNNYPDPYYQGWAREPIPGWGVRPVMAGPAMVGVGADPPPPPTSRPMGNREMLIALGALTVAGAIVYVLYKKGGPGRTHYGRGYDAGPGRTTFSVGFS